MSLKHVKARHAALKKDHEALDQDIADWRDWWSELSEMGKPHFGEMGGRLAKFRDRLAVHFADEEREGLLSLVMEGDRDVVLRIARLRDEHGELLAVLDGLIGRLRCAEPAFDCWGAARDEFEEFLDRLNLHEDAEDQLIEELL
ncbi:MAG: hemerythrin domain-containing protein [Planctomycetaceae bacterium]